MGLMQMMSSKKKDIERQKATQIERHKKQHEEGKINNIIEKFKTMMLESSIHPSALPGLAKQKNASLDAKKATNISDEEYLLVLEKTDLKFISYQQFKVLLTNPLIMSRLVHDILENHNEVNIARNDLE